MRNLGGRNRKMEKEIEAWNWGGRGKEWIKKDGWGKRGGKGKDGEIENS